MSNPLLLNAVQESQLFTTSVASDVQSTKGYLKIGSKFSETKKSLISDLIEVKYRAETVQVVTVTTGTSLVPAGNTYYTIEFGDTNRQRGGVQEQLKRVSYLTPADITTLGATAALQREAINVALIDLINDWTSSYYVTAATLAGGTGFTVTDPAGYYPVNAQGMTNRLGATYVKTCRNSDASGFVGTEAAITTAAVLAFGVGATLASWSPVTDQMWGNLISGYNGGVYPTTAAGAAPVSGQQYDGFAVISLTPSPIATSVRTQIAYMPKIQISYVDNGLGSSTTNLAGWIAYEREFLKALFEQYTTDPATVNEWFDKGYVLQPDPGVTPYTGTLAGTADVKHFFTTPYGTFLNMQNINAQTIFAPLMTDDGLRIEQDVNATDGAHYSGGVNTLYPSFIVGKTAFSLSARCVAGDWTDAFFMVGFRKKAAYNADYTTYDDLGAIGTQVSAANDYVATQGNINNGTTVETVSSTAIAADAVSVDLLVNVALDGTVTCFRNGVSFPIYSVGTTTLVFDAGDDMIPFMQFINRNSSASTLTFSRFVAVNSTSWRVVS